MRARLAAQKGQARAPAEQAPGMYYRDGSSYIAARDSAADTIQATYT